MTRNALDDLTIMSHILINYIDFIKQRVYKEMVTTQTVYSKLDFQKLSKQSSIYITEQMNYHISSMKDMYSLLLFVEKAVSDFYNTNQKPLPLYSEVIYEKAVQDHCNYLRKSLNALGKNQFL